MFGWWGEPPSLVHGARFAGRAPPSVRYPWDPACASHVSCCCCGRHPCCLLQHRHSVPARVFLARACLPPRSAPPMCEHIRSRTATTPRTATTQHQLCAHGYQLHVSTTEPELRPERWQERPQRPPVRAERERHPSSSSSSLAIDTGRPDLDGARPYGCHPCTNGDDPNVKKRRNPSGEGITITADYGWASVHETAFFRVPVHAWGKY